MLSCQACRTAHHDLRSALTLCCCWRSSILFGSCRKAVELARSVNPASVITLEEEWGDWLSSQKQMDAAINHYIEAGCTIKAIEAALADRQCAKAAGLVEFLEPAKAAPYFRRIAQLYEEVNNRCARMPVTVLGGGGQRSPC